MHMNNLFIHILIIATYYDIYILYYIKRYVYIYIIVKPHHEEGVFAITQGQGGSEVEITKMSYECRWGLTGFYPSMVFIALVYNRVNSSDQNVLLNDWYACLQVLSKQLTV